MPNPMELKRLPVPLREIDIFNNEHDAIGFTRRGSMLQQRIREEAEIRELLKNGEDPNSVTIRNKRASTVVFDKILGIAGYEMSIIESQRAALAEERSVRDWTNWHTEYVIFELEGALPGESARPHIFAEHVVLERTPQEAAGSAREIVRDLAGVAGA